MKKNALIFACCAFLGLCLLPAATRADSIDAAREKINKPWKKTKPAADKVSGTTRPAEKRLTNEVDKSSKKIKKTIAK